MSSIPLSRSDIKQYLQSVGPGRGRPLRPESCHRCGNRRIWFDGWRLVFCAILIDGAPARFDDGLWLQRVCCSVCRLSWTWRPLFLYPHRSFEPDLIEVAAFAYLKDPAATYERTAKRYGCSLTALWGWVGWLSQLAGPGEIVGEAVRLEPALPAAELIPAAVPQDHPKARSNERQGVLLRALQVLVAVVMLARAQPIPLADPSPLRWFLTTAFRLFRRKAMVSRPGWSPAIEVVQRGPTG